MRDLFLTECRRFRHAALIAAAIHLLLQIGLARVTDPLRWAWYLHITALAFYMLAGLGFALYQMGSYRQPGRWTWLMHRPLSRAAIFGAIALASAALIAFVVGLPALLTIFVEDVSGERLVDLRHYLMVLQLVLFVICAWMAGSYIVISRNRTAAVIVTLPFVLLMHNAAAAVMVSAALVCVALLAYVVYVSFKPDRHAPIDGALATAATATPLLLSFYWVLLWGGSLLFQALLALMHSHPHNMAVAPFGGHNEMHRLDPHVSMQRSLIGSTDPRAPRWRDDIGAAHIAMMTNFATQYAVRHQLSNTEQLVFGDAVRHITWTFSHDAMRYEGRDSVTGAPRGWLGAGGIGDATPFDAVPVATGDGLLLMPHALRHYDSAAGSVTPVVTLAPSEWLATEPEHRERGTSYIVTNQRMVTYEPGTPLRAVDSVPLPGHYGDLAWIAMAQVSDGRLVAFTFGERMKDGGAPGMQVLMLFAADGSHTIVATRPMAHDFAALFEHKNWWLSPALYTLLALPDALLDKGKVFDARGSTEALARARPAGIWLAALAATLTAALAAWWWLQPLAVSARRRAIWIASCLLFGLPALPTLMILQPRLARAGARARARADMTHASPMPDAPPA